MKRIIAVSLIALFALLGGGLVLACPVHMDDNQSGPAVLYPQTDGTQSTSTTPAPAGTVQQPNG